MFVSMVLMASAAPLTLTVGEEEGGGKVCSTTLKICKIQLYWCLTF